MKYHTDNLTLDEKRQMIVEAHQKCFEWWVDILDCAKSFRRQKIEMSFEEILKKLDDKCYFTVIHRFPRGLIREEQYLEIGFSTWGEPSYFLWVLVDVKHLAEFAGNLEPMK